MRNPLPLVLVGLLLAAPAAAQVADADLFSSLRWRNLGPANMGGRVVDIEAVEGNFKQVFLASASGGVFKSSNAGTTWEPIFDHYGSASIGDIAVFQRDPSIVWVGTGEANNRNSVAWGDGIYKSTDGGASFTRMGLETTHQIARVLTHPTDPDVVLVCAIGHLWGYSGDRGLFKTTDGGRSWTRLGGGLPADGRTGCTDLVMDPRDPNALYAAFYHRLRRPWVFTSGGPGGGIFKSTDGGRSWRKLTAGLPPGETGRIGLAVSRSRPDVVMALVEAARSQTLAVPGSGVYRSEDAGATWRYVNTYNNRPFYYSQIRINPVDDQKVYLLTTRFMVSNDGGRTLVNGSEDEEIHGDFHAMWLDPTDGDRYYIGMDKGAALTHDGGRAFQLYDNIAIGQYYRIGVDMRDPYYVYGGLQDNGSFAGPSFSREVRGILNDSNWKMHWGDGQDVQIDPTDWRTVYTSSENGSFRGYDPLTRRFSGGPPDSTNILNPAAAPSRPFRFNWSAPLVMSPHDPNVIYLGGNHVFRTTDGGVSWTIISPDLSTNNPAKTNLSSGGITPDNTGAETHASATTIAESPIRPGVIWVGTDDGNVQVTRDGGRTWTNVRANIGAGAAPARRLPANTWVGRIEASRRSAGTAYAVFDGHRDDRFTPWVYRTTDFGATWTDLGAGLPAGEVLHVLREDPRNPELLYLGTEFRVWGSLDGGASWHRLGANLPTVAVQDLVVHPRDQDLVAGTHGRSVWILDDLTPLQQLTPAVRSRAAHLFDQRVATIWENRSRGGQRGHFWWGGENPPGFQAAARLPRAPDRSVAVISYWLSAWPDAGATLEITTPDGVRRRTVRLDRGVGLRRYEWDLRFEPTDGAARGELATPGSYRLTLRAGDAVSSSVITLRADPLTATP